MPRLTRLLPYWAGPRAALHWRGKTGARAPHSQQAPCAALKRQDWRARASLPAGVAVAHGAARAPDRAVALEAAAEAQLPHAVAALHARRVLDVAQDVPAQVGGEQPSAPSALLDNA